MRYILFIPLIIWSTELFSQGSIMIEAFISQDCNLNELSEVQDLRIELDGSNLDEVVVFELQDTNMSSSLKAGNYSVTLRNVDGEVVTVHDVEVMNDRIRIVTVLFESGCELSRKEKRKRRKRFDNY